jgi:LacI family repressor for deo operon, udp, cdd, tsx, nupC, and nupG
VTQHELVARLGISRGTLHRVLTNSPLVKASTRERVLEELQRLNYTPNAIARGLKTKRTRTIGIIGPAAIRMSNIEKLNALHFAAQRQGYTVMVGYSDGSSEEDAQCIRDLSARMVDGFIVLSRGLQESVPHYEQLRDAGVPFVSVYPLPGLTADCAYVDTRRAFFDLTRHLIDYGHRKIGLMLDASVSLYSENREMGFREAMAKAGLPVNEDWLIRVTPDGAPVAADERSQKTLWQISDYQFGFWGGSQLLARKDRPTALVCFSDEFAIGVLRAADLAGVKVPEELAIVGYDDKEPARFARVPLTSMHQPDEKLGAEAVQLLIMRIEGKLPAKPVIRKLQATLVVRESSGRPRRRSGQS